MDISPTERDYALTDTLPYDDSIPPTEQPAFEDPHQENDENRGANTLMNRIARNKVYLLSESDAPRVSKVRDKRFEVT